MEQFVEFDDQAIESLEVLLHEFWILRDEQPDVYRRIREREKVLRRYLDDKFGLVLIIHQHFIKLEKIPVEPEVWMGIDSFHEQRDYVLFCYAMAFLEDKSVGEQFLLSELAEEIRHSYEGDEGVDWTIYTHRKSLIRTLKTMTDLKLIATVDGNIQHFDNDQNQEVLYETTVYSKYFIRSFPEDLTVYTTWQDVLQEDWKFHQEDERRKRVYRKLFFSPGVQRISTQDPDFAYIRNYRNRLQDDIEKHSHYQLRVFKNTALLTSEYPDYRYDYFPDGKAVTDIVLQLSYYLYENRTNYSPLETGELLFTMGEFDQVLMELKRQNVHGWSKYFRDAPTETLREDCVEALTSWMMAEREEGNSFIYLKPLLGMLAGHYPEDFTNKEDTDA